MKFIDRPLESVRPKHRDELRTAIQKYLTRVRCADGSYDWDAAPAETQKVQE